VTQAICRNSTLPVRSDQDPACPDQARRSDRAPEDPTPNKKNRPGVRLVTFPAWARGLKSGKAVPDSRPRTRAINPASVLKNLTTSKASGVRPRPDIFVRTLASWGRVVRWNLDRACPDHAHRPDWGPQRPNPTPKLEPTSDKLTRHRNRRCQGHRPKDECAQNSGLAQGIENPSWV
jgi:hypothetical protein